jgi:predicted dehydrogenase
VPAPHTLEVDATIQTLLGEGFVGEVLAVELSASGGRFVEPAAPMHWRQDISLSGHNILNMGIWYEAMMRWLGPAQRVTAMSKVAVPHRKDAVGASHEVRVPDHVDILAQFRGGAVAHLRFSSVTGLAPASEAWIFGREGTLRLEADTLRLTGGRRGESALREIPVPPKTRIGWRVEEEFVNAIRGREKIARTSFEDGVRYMEFTDAVTRSATTGQTVDVKDL